jgi:hypothetical protein
MYLLIARERKRYLKNSNGFGFSRPKPFFLSKKIPEKLRLTVKNTPKLSLLIFRFRVKIWSNEKNGIPK